MLSRVANLVYWMARYLERAENAARLVDVNVQLAIDLQSSTPEEGRLWEPLVFASGGHELYRSLYQGEVSERTVVDYMLFDRRNPSSVASCVSMARENARCIRDQISGEIWEQLNSFYLKLKCDDYDRYVETGSSDYLNSIKAQTQLFYGVTDSMLPRSEMWWFFELGRFLERADNTSRIIDVKYFMLLPDTSGVGSALDIVQWASVLRSCSGFEAFRKTRRGQLNLERVVDYLIRDRDFPRSVAFSVQEASRALEEVAKGSPHPQPCAARARLADLHSDLAKCDIKAVIKAGLHEYLDEIQLRLAGIHTAVQETFIQYPTANARVLR
jgi:uncharacterized alpha-E superfamily protein